MPNNATEISLGGPRRAGDVAQRRGKVEGRLPIREGADHTRAPPDLAQDALERICPLR